MRLNSFIPRILLFINVIGIIFCIITSGWIYLTHKDLTPAKTERVFKKNIAEANKIRKLDVFRQVHQSILVTKKRELNQHYENVRPIFWFSFASVTIFLLNFLMFLQLIKSKVIKIR